MSARIRNAADSLALCKHSRARRCRRCPRSRLPNDRECSPRTIRCTYPIGRNSCIASICARGFPWHGDDGLIGEGRKQNTILSTISGYGYGCYCHTSAADARVPVHPASMCQPKYATMSLLQIHTDTRIHRSMWRRLSK